MFVSEDLEATESKPPEMKANRTATSSTSKFKSKPQTRGNSVASKKKNLFVNEDLLGTESMPQLRDSKDRDDREEREKEEKGD